MAAVRRWESVILVLAAICIASVVGADTKPFIGGSLTWAINRDFRKGTRTVSLTLKSAWKLADSMPCEHLPGDKVSKCQAPTPEVMPRMGRLCYYLCDTKECTNIRDDVHLNATHRNDFTVQNFDKTLRYLSGSMTIEVAIPAESVNMFAFLCFDESNAAAVGTNFDWYGNGFATGEKFNGFYPERSGSPGVGQPGRYYGPISNRFTQNPEGASTYGRKVKLLSTFVHLCCTNCLVAGEQSTTSCSDLVASSPRVLNYYSPQPNVPLAIFLTANAAQDARHMQYKVSDYDGHPVEILPARVQGDQEAHVKYATTLRFSDEPPIGPIMTFQEFTKTSEMLQATPTGYGLRSEKMLVVEVQDFLWKALENLAPRSFKDCILANKWANDNGVLLTASNLQGMTPDKHEEIARKRLCQSEPTLNELKEKRKFDPNFASECSNLTRTLLLDLCPRADGKFEYDLYQGGGDPLEGIEAVGIKVSYAKKEGEFSTATAGGTIVQSITTPFVQNCRVDSTPLWHADIKTEIDCYPGDECYASLHASTTRAASEILFEAAPGSDRIQTCNVFDASTCPISYSAAPCGCCGSRSLCLDGVACNAETLSEHRCRFNARTPTIHDVGLSHVMCFVAKATFCKQIGAESEETCSGVKDSCYSTPVCVRFNFKGHSPSFIAPTPLQENALDETGQVLKGFTDIGACLGHTVPFTLVAEDVDADDQVRIIIDDTDRMTSFFFSDLDFSTTQSSRCGDFQAYAAKRGGDNAYQHSMLHLRNAEFDSSIVAALNDDIEWQTSRANQKVTYTLDVDLNNGIYIRSNCATTQMCRQRLLNADRTICGYALDNSRTRYKRWVGGRQLSHNFGSYSSARHCWRVRLQAPPSFVTNSTGCVAYIGNVITSSCTPFAASQHNISDTTDEPAAYAQIKMGYTSSLDLQFVAFDPNPDDRVSLFILEEPGMPEGMTIGRVQCIARDRPPDSTADDSADPPDICLQNCKANEDNENGKPKCECTISSGKFCPTHLSCNRAKLNIKWNPQVNQAGKTYKVCVAARDDSQLCHGVSPTATSNGWYSEKQCMIIEVTQVAFVWRGPWIQELLRPATPYAVYVGCTLTYDVEVGETTAGVSYGLYITRAETPAQITAQNRLMETHLTQHIGSSTVSLTPLRGSEGSRLTMCFSGGDQYGGVAISGICSDHLYKSCGSDADCNSTKCVPVCVTVEVQKCRYCVRDGDPLRTVMKDYLVDTNWLKVWALNNAPHSTLGTDCPPHLDCEQNVGSQIAIDNPYLMLGTATGVDKRILWAGLLYAPQTETSLKEIACNFRTNLKTLSLVNPDLDILGKGASSVVMANQTVCIAACTDDNVDPECSQPLHVQ